MILRRTDDEVICYSRTGRAVTSHWMDLAVPAMVLPPGTVLDGEAVIWNGGTVDFGAVQARAASSLDRARALAARLPATYAAFDILAHPDHGGDALASRPYTERRTVLVDVLAVIGPPLQPVLATADRDTAPQWYETLQPQGVEGIVAKPGRSAYPFGGRTVWRKIRHADTTDARVVGTVGPRRRPRRLALLLKVALRAFSKRSPVNLSPLGFFGSSLSISKVTLPPPGGTVPVPVCPPAAAPPLPELPSSPSTRDVKGYRRRHGGRTLPPMTTMTAPTDRQEPDPGWGVTAS